MTRRNFPSSIKRAAYKRAMGRCEKCTAPLHTGKFRYDHTLPDWLGGEPTLGNCQVICTNCDSVKTYTRDIPMIAKSKRVHDIHIGAKRPSSRPMPFGRNDRIKIKLNGQVVDRQTGLPWSQTR